MGNPKRKHDPLNLEADDDHPQFVASLGRGLSILRCFQHDEQYLDRGQIGERTGLAKSAVTRLTFTLKSLGFLAYSPALDAFSLGAAVVALGNAFVERNDVVAIAAPLMRELADYSKSAVMLAEPDGLRMVLLEICNGDSECPMTLERGSRVPHGSTALGRADLSARPLALFQRELIELQHDCQPGQWPRVREGILRARDDYERHGFCFSLGDWNPEVFAVGVPMVSADASRILAFNVSGRVSVMTRERLIEDFGPRLMALRDTVFERCKGRF
jgi:DNA-binding IclR family transcriptional regulator